jgi:hypothetical protein
VVAFFGDQMDFYIFISKCEAYYKIGISKDFQQRCQQISQSSPFEVCVFFAAKLVSEYEARCFERFFLSLFIKNKAKGEWLMFDTLKKRRTRRSY